MAEFEALVGYVHVVSGRSLVSQPPGGIAEAAPETCTRGREQDTFIALALPGSGNLASPDFYDQLVQLASELYFHAVGGGVTAGIREVFESLNRDLYEHNLASGTRFEVHCICAVLRRNELILGRMGEAVAIYQHEKQTSRFPTDFLNPTEMKRVPMGAHPVADLRLTRYTVAEKARLLLGGGGLIALEAAKVRAALQLPDLSLALQELQKEAPSHLSIQGVEFLLPETDSPPQVPLHRSSVEEPIPEEALPTTAPFEQPVRRGMAAGLRKTASLLHMGGRVTEQALGKPESEADSWLSFTTAAIAVFIVPVVVVLLIFLLWFSGTNRSALEICLEDTDKIYEVARSVQDSDLTAWRTAWQALLDAVEDCDPFGGRDETLDFFRAEAQTNLDILNYVSRKDTQAIATIPNGKLSDIVLRNRSLFILDSQGNSQVYHLTLSEDGLSVTGNPEPLPYLRGGSNLDGHTINRIIEIDWSEEALGFGNENVIVGLDDEGLLVDCLLTFLSQCQVQQLQRAEQWQNPTSLHIWDGRLYILDPPYFQIWRYEPSGGAYHDVPTEYFTGQGLPNIDEAVDFQITSTGDLFILRSDGVLQKYRGGIEQSFGLLAFPRLPSSADGLFIDESSLDSAIYVADADSRSVVKMSLGGSFIADFRLDQERMLAEIDDLVVDANSGLIYAISGNSVFVFPSS